MARAAVSKVIDTLFDYDFATIVLFDDNTQVYQTDLVAMTAAAKAEMKTWAETNIVQGGGTDFDAGLSSAFDILGSSSTTSGCTNKVILFMTDGAATLTYDVEGQAQATGARVMTYALGSGALYEACKEIACKSGGVFSAVGDDDDLGLAMASYYKVFAAGMSRADQCSVKWTNYEGAMSGVELLSACLPVFKTQPGEDTCSGASLYAATGATDAGDFADLLGCVPLLLLSGLDMSVHLLTCVIVSLCAA